MARALLTLFLFSFLGSLRLLAKAPDVMDAPAATEFIRVERSHKQVALQTAVTRYSKGDVHVDLIGAVHIADAAYYNKLNKLFSNYPVLLFEMIGGEGIGNGRGFPKEKEGTGGEMGMLNSAFNTMQNMLELSSQKDLIDYSAANFIHADLTFKEFSDLQKKRKESLLSFALKSSFQSDPKQQPNSISLLMALLSRDANKLKLQLVDTLGAGDNQIGALAGDNVIITDRNLKCLAVMQQHIDAGIKTLGIFYGAAHFPDMEKRLLQQGFTQTKHTWIDAWVIEK